MAHNDDIEREMYIASRFTDHSLKQDEHIVDVNIIVAFTNKKFGIGLNNSLPWSLPDDLKHFSKITKGSVVVMGKHTWNSIPNDKKPLKDRINVVVTTTPDKHIPIKNEVYVHPNNLDDYLCIFKKIFVIGGAMLYKKYMGVASKIYATVIEKDYDCDTYFPTDNFHHYEIDEYSELKNYNGIDYRFITYIKNKSIHEEFKYLNMIKDIVDTGNERPDRTTIGTRSLFGKQVEFDISKSLPLLTTKFVGYKSILKELLFFMQGKTDSKILEKQGVNIWKDNTTRKFLDNRGLTNYEVGEMGPMYGYNWRYFGYPYEGSASDYNGKGYDQLTNLIKDLKNDPFSRRHLMTTFDPSTVEKSVLAPCHGLTIQFYVEIEKNTQDKLLSCHMYQRSVDTFLGFPYNIASYAMFTYILAKMCDMKPYKLVISTGDTHIYNNHVEQVKTQLSRKPFPFPRLELNDSIKNKNIEDIDVEDFNLVGYLYHPSIKAPMAI